MVLKYRIYTCLSFCIIDLFASIQNIILYQNSNMKYKHVINKKRVEFIVYFL